MDFNTTGAMRSPFSPRVRQSISGRRPLGFSSAKKNQSKFMQSTNEQPGDVIYKTPMSTIETFGMPLPVMVTEALTFASGDISVRLSSCGWCWVVSGRRVLTWARSSTSNGTASPAPVGPLAARELTLPQTDLSHKADLVTLFYEDGAQMPSCIGVSPEGVVRYWPSVGQEGVYVDVTCELAGQECQRLGEATRAGLVLATTTCTIVLLNPTEVDGRATVSCCTLRPPSGWLGGIGRRVSLLFFGSMPTQADTLVGAVVVSPRSGAVALVARGPTLQVWSEHTLQQHRLRRALADAAARTHLAPLAIAGDLNSLEILALDVRAAGDNALLLLVAIVNVARSPEMRYAIAHISVEDPTTPRVTSLVPIRSFSQDTEEAPRFVPFGPKAILYTSKYIAVVSATVANDKVDFIDVSSESDKILGAELCNGVPLLFSKKHGVLALTTTDSLAPTPSLCDSPMGSPCPSDMYEGNLSLYEIDPHEVSAVTTDACGKMKTAFLFHLRRDSASCRALLDALFPPAAHAHAAPAPAPAAGAEERDVDAVLDRTVMRIATEMLDDIPAGDPRWKPRVGGLQTNIALGSSAALQISAQLRDKQRAFSLFIDFLRATGLWQRLGLVSRESGGEVISTECALGELAEQLTIALTLRRLQQGTDAQLIDTAIYQVVCGERQEVAEDPEVEAALSSGALSPADACYRRVTRAGAVLRAATHAAHTLALVTNVLTEVHKCRSQWHTEPPPPQLGPRALLPALAELQKRAITEQARACPEPALRWEVVEGAAVLADLLLSSAAPLHRDPRTTHLYERMRTEAIRPFMEEGELERAAVLAEKFKDFELLVELCMKNNDMDRLYTYIDKYANEGMAEVAFAWLASRSGAHAAALVRAPSGGAGAACAAGAGRLRAWLSAAAGRAPLHALHELAARRHASAAHALAELAHNELHSVDRMTTMASIAKLCTLASDENQTSDVMRKIENCLSLSEQHAALPRDIRIHYGLDTEDTRVVPPEELVQMYIESDSKSLTEYDYKKALDLTDFIQDMERRDDLRLRVWCACVRRDEWASSRAGALADQLHDNMFFRLVDLVHVMGGDLELLLPPLDDILTAPELAELVSDPKFHYMLKYGYECIDYTRNDNMDE
ncbi:nuclear pore complex protein Nup133 [Manduca sexta]|uniref:nuclear pore complex protein Nup133 n=1 Tax=Manduca sexta TaxID=7130 RepID=UPI00188F8ECC|nr:nuclear pore complex protein Nup133 [Manduca sexta]